MSVAASSVLALVLVGCAAAPDRKRARGGLEDGHTAQPSRDTDTDTHTDPDPPREPPRILDVRVEEHDEPNNIRLITVATDGPTAVTLACGAEQAPREDHVLRSGPPEAAVHAFELGSLLEKTVYSCTITATEGGLEDRRTLELEVQSLGVSDLRLTPSWGEGATLSAYTIFTHWVSNEVAIRTWIVDPEGRVRWYWDDRQGGGDRQAGLIPGTRELLLGGANHRPLIVDPLHRVRWQGPSAPGGGDYHHDADIDPDGHVLTLATATNQLGPQSWEGFRVDAFDSATDDHMWSWNSQSAAESGALPSGAGDLYHANAVSWVEDEHGVGFIVSLAHLDRILRIDPVSGEVLWQLGRGRDFTLIDLDGDPIADPARWFYFQHDPIYDGDSILLYDNGQGRPSPTPYSRGLRLDLDKAAMTATMAWVYREDGWYTPVVGGIDVLPNGNVLFAMSSFLGGNNRSAIVEVDPSDNSVVHRLEFPALGDDIYRAERIDGCDLFANRAYCPSL